MGTSPPPVGARRKDSKATSSGGRFTGGCPPGYPGRVDRAGVATWMDAYRDAWISNDPAEIGALFTDDAVYSIDAFAEPWRGREEIVRRWTAGIAQQVALHLRGPRPRRGRGRRALARVHAERRRPDPGRVRRGAASSVRAGRALRRASRMVLPARERLNAGPRPAATSTMCRAPGRGSTMRPGGAATTRTTCQRRSSTTTSIDARMPIVCTIGSLANTTASRAPMRSRPRSPRRRSARVSGNATSQPSITRRCIVRTVATATDTSVLGGPGRIRTCDTRVKSPLL